MTDKLRDNIVDDNNVTGSGLCPICQASTERVFQTRGHWLRECAACVHRFTEYLSNSNHVHDIYDSNYFAGGGDGYDDYLVQSEPLIRRGEFYGRLAKERVRAARDGSEETAEPRRVLDVGAAAGFVLEGYRRQGWDGRGLEPNQKMVDFANDRWELPLDCGTLEGVSGNETYDLISMIQVVAHFHDARSAFENAARLTKPGGYWLIETWDHRSLTAKIMGQSWHEYSPPTVLQCFSRSSLQKLAGQFGMQHVADRRTVKTINAGRAKALLEHKAKQSWFNRTAAFAVGVLPKRLNIPYLADDLFWMLLRKEPHGSNR